MDVIATGSRSTRRAPPFRARPRRAQPNILNAADGALLRLGRELKQSGYRFTAITPLSHRRVNARTPPTVATLQDIFGWSRPFRHYDLSQSKLDLLTEAGVLRKSDTLLRSDVRFATLGDQLFIHSAFPTEQADAVFFGPDTYRFARLIRNSVATLPARRPVRIADIGAGSGAGGLYAAALLAGAAPSVVLSDINRNALRFCRINASLNGASDVAIISSDLFDDVDGHFDLVVSNPPYLVDPAKRVYRHGGGELGSSLSLKIVEHGIARLAPGGRLILYTGSAIVRGVDKFRDALGAVLNRPDIAFVYDEIDPDVFGEELEQPPYDGADRIAVVGVTVDRAA
jgi:release factor glutamine methyltransferase